MNERVGTTMERPARSRSSESLFPRSATESGFERGQSPLARASVRECHPTDGRSVGSFAPAPLQYRRECALTVAIE
jgi:hypothetical protein